MTRNTDDENDRDAMHRYVDRRKKTVRQSTWEGDITPMKHLRRFLQERDIEPHELTQEQAEEFLLMLKNRDMKEFNAGQYALVVNAFYDYTSKRNAFEIDHNPIEIPLEDIPFENDVSTERRDIELAAMRDAVRSIQHPLIAALIVTFLKTGMRVGECCNLDLRDVHIDHPRIGRVHPGHRAKLDNRPDTIYVADKTEMAKGEETNGEVRDAGNKRSLATYIPIDDELKRVLVEWLMVRPDSRSPADPLFTITRGGKGTVPGDRLRTDRVGKYVASWAEDQGWWESGATLETNVTPHYFRHYFTTMMRRRTNDETLVQYIRGDKGSKIIDRYTHNWGDLVRTKYLEHNYKFR